MDVPALVCVCALFTMDVCVYVYVCFPFHVYEHIRFPVSLWHLYLYFCIFKGPARMGDGSVSYLTMSPASLSRKCVLLIYLFDRKRTAYLEGSRRHRVEEEPPSPALDYFQSCSTLLGQLIFLKWFKEMDLSKELQPSCYSNASSGWGAFLFQKKEKSPWSVETETLLGEKKTKAHRFAGALGQERRLTVTHPPLSPPPPAGSRSDQHRPGLPESRIWASCICTVVTVWQVGLLLPSWPGCLRSTLHTAASVSFLKHLSFIHWFIHHSIE